MFAKTLTEENTRQPGNLEHPWAAQLAPLKYNWIPNNQRYPEDIIKKGKTKEL